MSSDFEEPDDDEPTGLEDEPVDCYTNFYVIELPNPDDPNGPPIVHDGEVISDHPLSENEIARKVMGEIGDLLRRWSNSPRFRARFGPNPTYTVIGTGSVFGC